jgi:hypothetical protein
MNVEAGMIDKLAWRVQRLADSVPGYRGYREREDRRDADKRLRMQLAQQYDAQRQRLAGLQTQMVSQGRLEGIADLERVGLKLQRFIDRLRTASYGYAGWFDGPVIGAAELEQLIAFDTALNDGLNQVSTGIDAVAGALSGSDGLMAAVNSLGNTLDTLNLRFDQRQDLLEKGKKLAPAELAKVLEGPSKPPSQLEQELMKLKINDAVTYEDADYLISARATYHADGHEWVAYQLKDSGAERWLRAGHGELALLELVDVAVQRPLPAVLEVAGERFNRTASGTAEALVEGPGGQRRGSIAFARYQSASGESLVAEDWGDAIRVLRGQPIEPEFLKLWPRK